MLRLQADKGLTYHFTLDLVSIVIVTLFNDEWFLNDPWSRFRFLQYCYSFVTLCVYVFISISKLLILLLKRQ